MPARDSPPLMCSSWTVLLHSSWCLCNSVLPLRSALVCLLWAPLCIQSEHEQTDKGIFKIYIQKGIIFYYKCDSNERVRWIYLVAGPAHPVHWAGCLSSSPGHVCTSQSALPCLFWGCSGPWVCGISSWRENVMKKERKEREEWNVVHKKRGCHTCCWWRLAACCFRVAMIVLTALYSLLSSIIKEREGDAGEKMVRWGGQRPERKITKSVDV